MAINKRRLLLCDEDRAYAEALTEYLISTCKEYSISVYTSTSRLSEDTESYDVSLISEDFLETVGSKDIERFGRLIILSADSSSDYNGYEKLFKFQSMENLLALIRKPTEIDTDGVTVNSSQQMIGIYSPMRHELALPFALAVCNILSSESRVLFVDLEDLSIMPELIEGCTHDMLDLLYLLGHKKEERIMDYIGYCEGFSYLPPMSSLGEQAYITPSEWDRLIEAVKRTDQETVVILFDHMIQGFEGMISKLDGFVLLEKDGDYYRQSHNRFMNFLKYRNYSSWIRKIDLPLNASNLADGNYSIGQLLRGNLGSIVRTAWENGTYVAAG